MEHYENAIDLVYGFIEDAEQGMPRHHLRDTLSKVGAGQGQGYQGHRQDKMYKVLQHAIPSL